MKIEKKQANIYSPIKHRYSLALREIKSTFPQILDVGGYISRNEVINKYFDSYDYKSINVGSAWYSDVQCDYLYDGEHLPFDRDSFDYLISIDTLEHILDNRRSHFINEMKRVAKKQAIIVTPFRIEGIPTYENYVLRLCKQHNIEAPPAIVEHEAYGLPFLDEIESFAKIYSGNIKLATIKHDYWHLQISMLWNSIALQCNSEIINRELQIFQEKLHESQPDPTNPIDAYRCVLCFDN